MRDQLDHFGKRLGVVGHEFFEVGWREVARLVKNRAFQEDVERDFARLVGVEREMVASFEIGQVEMKTIGQSPAYFAIPAVGQQNAANVKKQWRGWKWRALSCSAG